MLWSLDVSSVGAAFGYLYTSLAAYKLGKGNLKITLFGIMGAIIGGVFILLLLVPVFSTSLNRDACITLFIWCIIGIFFKISTLKIDRKLG